MVSIYKLAIPLTFFFKYKGQSMIATIEINYFLNLVYMHYV
jgi:hypothetical protein